MMYNTTGDKLRRTEEQRQVEVQERQKVELALRNFELEMRILVNNKKQVRRVRLSASDAVSRRLMRLLEAIP